MKQLALVFVLGYVILLSQCTGSFHFKNIETFCNETNLIWNYVTNETVTVIEWYKQPGILIARIFGVHVGAPFTVLSPYNAAPYNVTKLSEYNAAIRITGMTQSDSGVYSVNITAACPQSAFMSRHYTCQPEGPVVG